MRVNNTIWFDISELKGWTGHFTGIQRVVFNIGKELANDKDIDIRFCRFDYRRKAFTETSYNFVEPTYERSVKSGKVKRQRVVFRVLKKILPGRAKRLAKSLIGYASPPYFSITPTVKFADGDTLFIAGAFWTGQLEGVRKIRETVNVKTVGIMYDMVPVMMPHLCTHITEIDFSREIDSAIKVVDKWISISENTKKDLIDYAKSRRIKMRAKENVVVKLGSDINVNGESKSPFTKKDRPEEYILFVSTIEARKNQNIIYQTVKLADEQGVKIPPIVLVGKHGWHSDDTIALLRRDKSVKHKIIWFDSADDTNLRWLYKNSLFTIYPSLYEGWGLPVAESIAYKKFCLASNNSSIPEVAGNLIDYFSPYSAESLLRKIKTYSNNRVLLAEKERSLEAFTQQDWTSTARQIADVLR